MDEYKVLLVQCCNLPQFFYLAEKLRRQHPDWRIDFLVTDHRHGHFYLKRFDYSEFHIAPCRERDFSGYDAVLFPLFNRGYWSIKRRAWSIRSERRQVDYHGNLYEMNAFDLLASFFRAPFRPGREFEDFIRQFPYPELGKRVLIVESCPPALIKKTAAKLESVLPVGTEIQRISQGSLLQGWKDFRRQGMDGAVVYLSSKTGFQGIRFLPFLLRVKNILVINENGDFSSGGTRDVAGYFLRRLSFRARISGGVPRVLFLQTEGPEYAAECLKRLRKNTLFPTARILLVCGEEDRARLEVLEGVVKVISWKQNRRFSQAFGIRKQIRAFRPDLNCAAFTGRPVFRVQKLAYFLLGSRKKLAFNAGHDAYWMTLGTMHRVFKKEPMHLPPDEATKEVLLLESSSDANMLVALQTVQEEDVVPSARVTVFCREDKKGLFEGYPATVQTVTYSKGALLKNLKALWQLFRAKPDVLAAVFAGAKIYPKHRILFWLLPARNRLAFNQNLDCFYVDRRTFRLLIADGSDMPRSWLRYGLRAALFLPRFIYLLAWWAGWKLGLMRVR